MEHVQLAMLIDDVVRTYISEYNVKEETACFALVGAAAGLSKNMTDEERELLMSTVHNMIYRDVEKKVME